MPLNAAELIKQYECLMEEHQFWRPRWQELADYMLPKRSQFTVRRQPGARQTEKLFDSTALDACDRLANILNGTLTSRAAKWFSLRMRNESLNDNKEVDQWLESSSKKQFAAFNQSNLAQEIAEIYQDEVVLGTGNMVEEERDPASPAFSGLRFTALSLTDYGIAEDADGVVNELGRTFQLSAVAIVGKWGKKQAGEKVNKAMADGKPEKKFTILHSIFPREPELVKLGGAATNLPFVCAYTIIENKHIILESGYHEFPCMVPRWSKTSGEVYGRGPGYLALPDVKTLNKIKEKVLRATAKAVDPPTKTLREMVGPIRNVGGGNTVVSGDIGNIQPLFQPGYFDSIFRNDQIKSSELRQSIERIFYADQMQLPVGPAMTAYEVAKRFELLQRLLGPTMGRQESELLNPLIRRTFGIMLRKGAFDPIPAILLSQPALIDVQYEGPLARSQRLQESEGIEQMAQVTASIASIYPGAADVIDWDKAIRRDADIRGVPAELIRDPMEIARMRAERARQQQEQQDLADASKAAEMAGKMAPALQLVGKK